MVQNLKPFELQEYYQKALANGVDGLIGIETLQANQLRKHAISQRKSNEALAISLVEGNPEYKYPPEFEKNQLEYWKRNNSHYGEPEKVIDAIDRFLGVRVKDQRFWLTGFWTEQAQKTSDYIVLRNQIEANGCFIISTLTDKGVKVYNPELAFVFCSNELFVKNLDTNTETTINGSEYIATYIEGYKEGAKYFDTEFKVSTDTLYGPNPEPYVRDIHENYFHKEHETFEEGWQFIKNKYSTILTHNWVKKVGYFSGIVSKVDAMVAKYPKPFQNFHKCEHNSPPQQTETKTDKPKAPVLGLFCGLLNQIGIDKKEETESVAVYCKRVCIKYKLPYTDRVRQNFNVNETKKLIQEITEKILPLIDDETKALVQNYLDRKQPPKQNLYA